MVTHRGTHLAPQIAPMCSVLLTKGRVSKYQRLHCRNIHMGSKGKWQKSKLLITKDNKRGHCNTMSQSEMGFHSNCFSTLHLEMQQAKCFTNKLTIYYCLKCRHELAKKWPKKKVFLINTRLQNNRLKLPEGFLPSHTTPLFFLPWGWKTQPSCAAASWYLVHYQYFQDNVCF